MKILVTGSSGHAGLAIAQLLQQKGHAVLGLDQREGPLTHLQGDLNDWTLLKKAVKQVDAIIHTASLHAPHVPSHSREQFIQTNVQATLHLLELAKTFRLKRLVYTSTTSLYGHALESDHQAVWVTEEVPPQPRDIYDISKLTAEQLCQDFYRSEGLSCICLRVSRFWNEPLPDRLWYRMYRGLALSDVAAAHQLALMKEEIGYGLYNISAQSPFVPEELTQLKFDPLPLVRIKLPGLLDYFADQNWPLPSSIDRVYVIEKAKRELGFNPLVNAQAYLDQLNT